MNNYRDIILAPIITEKTAYAESEGKYAFKAMPAGDFIIRFIYGDTTQTVLTTTDGEGSEVTELLNGASDDAFLGTSGLNKKSYKNILTKLLNYDIILS